MMELTALDTARDFSSYLDQDFVQTAFETLPDEVRRYIRTFAYENERNLDDISTTVEDALSELQEAAERIDSAANETMDAAASANSALDGLGRLS